MTNYKRKIKNFCLYIPRAIRRSQLKDKEFSIIANNCWAGFVYQYFGLEYESPFAGLFLFSPDYIELIKSLKNHMGKELLFIDPEKSKYRDILEKYGTLNKYPIGVLGDSGIEIHFLHYKDKIESKEKWDKRTKRINYDKLIFKFCDIGTDVGVCSPKLIKEFTQMNFPRKICLTSMEYNLPFCLKLKNEDGEEIKKDEWKNFCKTVNVVKFINDIMLK